MKGLVKENKTALVRLVISLCLVAFTFVITHVVDDEASAGVLNYIVYGIAYVLVAYEVIFGAIKELFTKRVIAEKMLMTVASLGAFAIEERFEAVIVVVLYVLGELVEETAKEGAKRSIDSLEELCVNKARRENGEMVLAETVQVGEIIEVLPGERIPLDGVVCNGTGLVDTSVITGESMPRDVRVGNEVLAGYLNKSTVIQIKVSRPFKQSAAQRIVQMSQVSLDKKTKSERFISKFARIYTPIVISAAVLVAAVPTVIGLCTGTGEFTSKYIYVALSMLAIACPCAFVISIPLAYFCGMGFASRRGILIKGSAVMDSLRSVEVMAFDKTGTLTKSELHVTKIETASEDINKLELLKLVAIAERKSIHPVAIAVVTEAKKFNIEIDEGENHHEVAGSGVECDSKYGHIKAGNRMFADAPSGIFGTVYISLDGKYIGCIGIGDELKTNSKIAFERLRKLGVRKKVILSGDKKSKVDVVAKTLLAELAYSNLKPEEKVGALEDIMVSEPGAKIAYCGDGINDIPALARADIGIAMGAIGSDSAVDTSDVIIVDDNIEKVPLAIKIAKRTHRTVIFNIVMSLTVKALMLGLLAVPGLGVTMLHAVCADVGVLILAILNSLRAGR